MVSANELKDRRIEERAGCHTPRGLKARRNCLGLVFGVGLVFRVG